MRRARSWVGGVLALVAAATVLVSEARTQAIVEDPVLVQADVETVPVLSSGDAADDPALWIDPDAPGSSLLIGNDKGGALEVYELDGSRRQRITTATPFWGNVDVRQRATVGGQTVDVVAGYNGGLRLYTVNANRQLVSITDGNGVISTNGGEGLCLYNSAATGELSAFVITRPGRLGQFRIHDGDGDGRLEGSLVRQFQVGSEAEGCVADDATGALYVSQEDVGLWRYGAEPGDGSARTSVDTVQPSGHLAADVEGVTLVDDGDGGGYIIASAQNVAAPNRSYFVIYDRLSNDYVDSFRVVAGDNADSCERTDGITAYYGDLGPSFPNGVFVCQDNDNLAPGSSGFQNFKLVSLDKILDLGPPPTTTTTTSSTTTTTTEPTSTSSTSTTTTTSTSTTTTTTTTTTTEPPPPTVDVSFVAAASTNANRTIHRTPVPVGVVEGDVLLAFFAGNTSLYTVSVPAGWTPVGSLTTNGLVGWLWTKVATAGEAGSPVVVLTSGYVKADLSVVAYRDTADDPIVAWAVAAESVPQLNHVTPTVDAEGGWLVSYWADKSVSNTSLAPPASVALRSQTVGTGGGHITTALADSDGPVPAGVAGGLTATPDAVAARALMFTVALRVQS